ncbi:DUF2061 domain-containing protein [Halalkalicoccus subterraneus]|uniref:DUF2061 domain-containing protein n=1 Tax=Halalkalicoccus subterraneus TaxID=2675002 RepID=UPI000EFC3D98|nr:DUF2061 domain-containing protein [Halalkalicoccus subterraneus]
MTDAAFARQPSQSRSRAIVKTVCYRLFMFAITAGVAFLVTGAAGEALSIGVATNLLKTGTYYVYERAWAHVTWGVDVR